MIAALGVVLPRVASAETTLPVIVTYEMAKARDAERAAARDPKGFWIRQIVARLEDKKLASPITLTSAATVQVSFTLSHDGHVTAKAVKASSGVPAIDAAALQMVDRAAPFPPMPAGLDAKDLSFTLPLRFR